jgi:hypothetical protein
MASRAESLREDLDPRCGLNRPGMCAGAGGSAKSRCTSMVRRAAASGATSDCIYESYFPSRPLGPWRIYSVYGSKMP